MWTLENDGGLTFATLEVMVSSIRDGSRVRVRDPDGRTRAEIPFSAVDWSHAERAHVLRSVCRGFDPPIEVSNWHQVESGDW